MVFIVHKIILARVIEAQSRPLAHPEKGNGVQVIMSLAASAKIEVSARGCQ
jgi:hypothetical protein